MTCYGPSHRQVERERLRADETATKSTLERTALDRSLSAVEQENQQLQRQCSSLEQQLQQLQLQLAQRGPPAAHGQYGRVSRGGSGGRGTGRHPRSVSGGRGRSTF